MKLQFIYLPVAKSLNCCIVFNTHKEIQLSHLTCMWGKHTHFVYVIFFFFFYLYLKFLFLSLI